MAIPNLKNAPIQRKLMSVIVLTCAIVLLLMCAASVVFEYFTFRKLVKGQVSTLAAVVSFNSAGALAFDSQDDAAEILRALKAESHIVAASLYDENEKLFAHYPDTAAISSFPLSPTKAGYTFKDGYLEGFEPVMQQNSRLGTLYIRSDLQALYDQLKSYGLMALLLMSFSLLIAYILSMALQQSISEPILALQLTARRVSENNDYTLRGSKMGNDEIGALTDAFNTMLARIEEQNAEITRFNQLLEQRISERTIELEEANTNLNQQKEFIESIVDSSVDSIVVYDSDSRFVTVNKTFENRTGFKREQVIGRLFDEFFPEETPSHQATLQGLQGEYVHIQQLQSPITGRYYESFFIPLFNTLNKQYALLTIGHDITDIVESSEQLRKTNSSLEKSNRDLEQFAYIASHDLQEPLRKILVFTQLLGQNFDNKDELQRYHQKISQSATRMQELIRDVLNFSRISNSDEAYVSVNLNEIVENLKIDFELFLSERSGVVIHETLPTIQGIPLQLSQLFSNLISNSLKYSENNPVITIRCSIINAEDMPQYHLTEGPTEYYHINFSDNGIGFDPEYSEKIFTIFQRLHSKQTYSGTGIGLALCRKIVENHHGVITAESTVGQGATFHIFLPSA